MSFIKSILLIVYLFPFGSSGQFRIVGLLNVDESKSKSNHLTTAHHSNAQGRGFSVDEGQKKFWIRPKNIIRVHLIDDVNQSNLNPETEHIFMFQTEKSTNQHKTTVSTHNDTNTKKLSNSEIAFYHTKQLRQTVIPFKANKYQHKLNSVIPDAVNRSPVYNPVELKHHKAITRNRYKSRCRCERISNCRRIQLSVSRCEPNYFLCCF